MGVQTDGRKDRQTKTLSCVSFNKFFGGIPYTAHGAQITTPLIFDFCLC